MDQFTDAQKMQSLSTQAARNLSTTTKTEPQMVSITNRWLLNLLPWVHVGSGTYRVNKTKLVFKEGKKIDINIVSGKPVITPESFKAISIFDALDESVIAKIIEAMTVKETGIGTALVTEGLDGNAMFIVAEGKVEISKKGEHGETLIVKIVSAGSFFGEDELTTDALSAFTAKTSTPCKVLCLTKSKLDEVFKALPGQAESFEQSIKEKIKLKAELNEYGEANINIEAGHQGEPDLPETFVDYTTVPQEYPLSVVQTIMKVHTRVMDLYNDPINQLEQQMRLTVEGMKEKQESEIINNKEFGLLNVATPEMRIQTRSGSPTPDDLDELLSLVWKKPSFFLAHPRAIAAFTRECTRRGVPPVITQIEGANMVTWRGVPLIPCDKLTIQGSSLSKSGAGTTNILLLRAGEKERGVVGLHQEIQGEIAPSLNARLMGINRQSIASYLLSLYFSCAVLTDDALGVLENVEVGFYHDYSHEKK